MAERRMFAKSIVLSDAFLDMPMSARCLYFTMGMLADDDGFIGNPKSIMRQCGATDDDMKILLAKRYVLGFDNGVIVIKHWRMNNYLQNDRHKRTTYLEELAALDIDEKGSYTEKDKACIQNVYKVYTQDSIGKNSIDKNSIDKDSIGEDYKGEDKPEFAKEPKHKYGEYKHVLLSDDEFNKLIDRFGEVDTLELIRFLDEAIEIKHYKYNSHYLVIAKKDSWVQKEVFKNRGVDWSKV